MTHSYTFTHLSRQEGPILELAEEEGNEEAAQHEAHGEQGRVGEGEVLGVGDLGHVTGDVVDDVLFGYHRVPGVVCRHVQMLVVPDKRVVLEDLKKWGQNRDRGGIADDSNRHMKMDSIIMKVTITIQITIQGSTTTLILTFFSYGLSSTEQGMKVKGPILWEN